MTFHKAIERKGSVGAQNTPQSAGVLLWPQDLTFWWRNQNRNRITRETTIKIYSPCPQPQQITADETSLKPGRGNQVGALAEDIA